MGQASSRQEHSSSQRHPRPTSQVVLPDDVPSPTTQHTSATPRSSRYGTFFRSRPTQTVPEDCEVQDSRQTSDPRRRSRLSWCHPSRFSNTPSSLLNRHASPSLTTQPSRLPSPPITTPQSQSTPAATESSQLQVPSLQPDLDFPPLTRSRPLTRNPIELIEEPSTSNNAQSRTTSRWRPRSPFNTNAGVSPMLSWRRRSPIRRDNDDTGAMLTRLLSAAAAATAISLTGGNTSTGVDSITSGGRAIDGDDGSFDSFLQSLSNGGLASTLNQSEGARADLPSTDAISGQPIHLDFFRMFRFGSSDSSQQTGQISRSRRSSRRRAGSARASTEQGPADTGERERMVPVLMVGIHALTDEDADQERAEGMPNFLEQLTTFSTPVSVESSGEASPEDVIPASAGRRSRRSTIGGLNFFSSDRDGTRSQEQSRPGTSFASSSESPSGPHPPPPTPASPGLSAMPSGNTTPTRRSSISSIADLSSSQSRRGSLYRRLTGTALEPTLEEQQTPQEQSTLRPRGLRRRPRIHSWAESPRHDTRRNGVLMEPSTEIPSENSSTRSWIIYILGGNYPEHHPILTTPSLFTDNPTYEDMLLLSSLIGPAKPLVANAQDVAASGGLYTVKIQNGDTVAMDADGKGQITIPSFEQCQVCISSYQEGEEARRLVNCKHLFHRECIDQWLTTGGNSCPLCRSRGVEEKPKTTEAEVQEVEAPCGPDGRPVDTTN